MNWVGGLPPPTPTCQTSFIEFPRTPDLIPEGVSHVCRVTDDSVTKAPALPLLLRL